MPSASGRGKGTLLFLGGIWDDWARSQLIPLNRTEGEKRARRIATETEPFGQWLRFSYDANGNTTGVADSSGGATVSTYNADGQLLARQLSAPGSPTLGVGFQYDADGQIRDLTRTSNGTIVGGTSYSYDAVGNPADIVHVNASGQVIDGFAYTSNADGQITSESNLYPGESLVAGGTQTGGSSSVSVPRSASSSGRHEPSSLGHRHTPRGMRWPRRNAMQPRTLSGGKPSGDRPTAGSRFESFVADNKSASRRSMSGVGRFWSVMPDDPPLYPRFCR